MRSATARRALGLIAVLLAGMPTLAGGDATRTNAAVSGGGASSGGTLVLYGAIGCPAVGVLSGGTLRLEAGSLSPDASAGVTALVTCLSGPDGGMNRNACRWVDMDGDGDVDLADFAISSRLLGS